MFDPQQVFDQWVQLLKQMTGLDLSSPEALFASIIGKLQELLGPIFGGVDLTNPPSAEEVWEQVISTLIVPLNLLLGPNSPLNALNLFNLIPGGLIPGLDASKIISGIFTTGQIPILDASQIGTGTFLGSLIPGLDASKIISGIFGNGQIPTLDASKIGSGTFLGSLIPGLDASKIITGTFGGGLIPDLDAAKIITGTFGLSRIPNLPAGQITSGTFLAGLIPGLDASKIVSGIFGSGVIPDLDAAKIITGTLGLARIPGLPAGQITSGVFGAGFIPGLDASKITSGIFPQSMVNITSIPGSIVTGTVAGVQALQDSIWQAFGGSGSGSTTNVASVINNYQTRITALEGGGTLTRFGSNGTWTNPTPTQHKKILVRIYNGGQGGAKLASTTPGSSNGGLGGGCVEKEFYTDEIPSSVAVTVGPGTAGGPAGSSASNPALGATSQFGSLLSGAADTGDLNLKPGKGGDGSYTGSTTSATPAEWGEGNKYVARAAKGTTGAGAAGANSPSGVPCGGAGGGGGGSNTSPAGFNGGNGGAPGGGGGGAGKGINATSGAGGNGGAGALDVITY
ncbi:hypothetical protein BKG77_06910 [Mycobacteroides chelonae]|nr:hypothetical protein BKG77_06910 [Mycobacteroides chelonae]